MAAFCPARADGRQTGAGLTKGKPKVLVQEWFKDTQSKQRVEKTVQDVLEEQLPETYDRALFKTKCDDVFALVFDHASHGRKWAA